MIRVGVVGATGYAGQELVRLLYNHPDVSLEVLASRSYENQKYSEVYGNFFRLCDKECMNIEMKKMAEKVDVIFLALPHGIASNQIDEEIISKVKIIDLGADYRLNDVNIYEDWYKTKHGSPNLLDTAVYGLCEWKRKDIKETSIIANPGCYTTCSILSLSPLLKDDLVEENSIVIDAKSGVSGAGRGLNIGTHYTECNESIKAYKLASHRHTPEIEQQLSEVSGKDITLTFTPHLVPMNRGILVTAYANLKKSLSYDEVKAVYEKYYGDEFFIRLLPEGVYPETRWVKGSNYCDINFVVDERTNRIIVLGTIDNVVKGAAGQAVQNMNIMFDLPENKGLQLVPMFPA